MLTVRYVATLEVVNYLGDQASWQRVHGNVELT